MADDYAANTGTRGRVAIGGQSSGSIETAGDRDWFAVTLTGGQAYAFTLNSLGLNDPYLSLYNASGVFLTSNDDSGGNRNSRLVYTPTVSGNFFLAARDYASGVGAYRVTAALANDYAGSVDTLGAIAPGQILNGRIESAGDQDWLALDLQTGQSVQVRLDSTGLADPFLTLYGSDGVAQLSDDDGGGSLNSRLDFTVTQGGRFYLGVGDYDRGAGNYALAVALAVPDDFTDDARTTSALPIGQAVDGRIEVALGNSSFDVSGSTLRLDRLWAFLLADADWFTLGDLGDAVNLGGGNDFGDAGGGDDRLQGGQGDDVLLGGSGNDTGIWTGSAHGVRVQKLGTDNWRVTDPTGAEGADSIHQIETLHFADAVLSLANLPDSGTPGYRVNDRFMFDEVFYLLSHADLAATISTAAAAGNYMEVGAAKGYAPNSWFGGNYYKTKWADLTALNLDDATLFRHFNLYGVWEGRSPGALFDQFDGARYLQDNPDVANYVDGHLGEFLGSRSNGALANFLIYGASEGRASYDSAGHGIDLNYKVDLFAA